MGGSAPSAQLIDRVKGQLDCKLYNSYGATEVGHISIYEVQSSDEIGAWIRPPIELQIVDDNDIELPAMSVGHIRYRRKDMATSYYKNPEATAEFFKDGYFYPGDLGFIDSVGRLFLEGRSTEVINLGGVKVNPERIEIIARAQLGVRDCAAYGRINDSGVEELGIALVVDEDFDKENFEKAMAAKSLHRLQQARILPAIPRNENGKIQRHLLSAE
jgi:acyl-CoA synthetase (AMP-forming)/AMP-acid ligase II